jgi:release factor glutamine methyltransferase
MTGAGALAMAIRRLTGAGVPDPARDARRLLAHALGVEAAAIIPILQDPLDPARFFALVDRRAAREPVAKITGRRLFYGRAFRVTPDVLDPRPETELLVDLALAEPFEWLLDLGTGTGCLLLSLLAERPLARGQGVDCSAAALEVARANATALGLAGRATLSEGDWFGPVTGRFDLIVANPPYIADAEMEGLAPEVRDWDPSIALTDGGDGLGACRTILAGAAGHLTPGGRLIVEIGWRQGPAVVGMFHATGLEDVSVHSDLEGRDRVATGRKPRHFGPNPAIG